MKALRFTPAAYADIDRIWDYTADLWGIDQAESYTDDIQKVCEDIAHGVKIGRPSTRRSVFKQRSGAHFIYYRMTTGSVEIIRILHGKQDVERHL
ncbi:type II toxin-antitoxin system RelE/ParE family toxin [Novosphingobium jiangmenense]|uniref:Toxin n=1 Tax=Novosphingobium jiangmenense TaxID=2791981 RepID=A0ABS0HKC5_9SPHN|nr:type II toxin-antitoxin system RelE/ParE family toxin [Novosphingobium jiangmenense]MBF9152715.1 type II toxin-antitoxin system RelE/ParE family toxin [Novosphingobium jiangmenense]